MKKAHDIRRVAFYIPSLDDAGPGRVLVALSKGFARRGYAVDLVLSRADGPYLKQSLSDVRIVDLGAKSIRTSLPALLRYVSPLAGYLRRDRPSVMMSVMNHANVVALLAKRSAHAEMPLVIGEHTHLSASLKRGLRDIGARRGLLMPEVMQVLYPQADCVVAVSNGVADDLAHRIRLPRERVQVIHNPAVTPEISELAQALPSHPWFAPGEPPVILGVGQLIEDKGFGTLIEAFARIRGHARLVILGEGSFRPQLEKLIRSLELDSSVSLAGFRDNPFAYMHRAALFVLSSQHEALPTVLIEAMACGAPVVSTDCPGGPAEILENGKWGRLVPVDDVDALANAMLNALAQTRHPDVARRAQDFGVEQAVDRYLELFRSLVTI